MKRDELIFDIIEKEHQRQLKGIELIASENFVSDQVMQAMGSCLTNKYAEGYPGKRYYGGCEVVDQSERIAIERLKEIFKLPEKNPIRRYSKGMQKQAAFHLTLSCRPEVLILDEPTSQLDPIAATDFLQTLGRINRELGTTILICEHRLEDVIPMANRLIILDLGEVIADETPAGAFGI